MFNQTVQSSEGSPFFNICVFACKFAWAGKFSWRQIVNRASLDLKKRLMWGGGSL